MKLRDILNPKFLVPLYQTKTTLELLGPPGCGKSSVIRLIPDVLSEALGVPFPPIHPRHGTEVLLPSVDAPDARGFLIPTKDEQGRPVARYTYPAIFPPRELLEQYDHGVMFYDEGNQADGLVQKAMAPVYLEKTIGEHSLPDNWWVVSASNRMSDRAGVVKPMSHIINRKRTVEIEPDIQGWATDFAEPNELHPMGIAFALRNPGVFASDVPAEPHPYCTLRSFTSAMSLLKNMVGVDMELPSDGVTQQLVAGDIGEGASATFFGFIKVAEFLPTIEEVVRSPETAKLPPHERLDAAFAAAQMCLHHADVDTINPIWIYLERLPRELQVASAKKLTAKAGGGLLLNSKRLNSWIAENRALIMTTMGD